MNGIYEIKNLSYEIDPDAVLRTLRCGKDNPQRAEMEAEFRQLKGLAETLLSPVGILGFGMLPDSKRPVVYMVTGVGGAVSEQVTDYFEKGDYVRGMLLDAMADHALFSLEKPMLKALRERCAARHIGVAARLEAPEEVPMSIQRTAWEYLELEKRFGITISGGNMFHPVKTSCVVLALTEQPEVFHAGHDCARCPKKDCKMRSVSAAVPVTVLLSSREQPFDLESREQPLLLKSRKRQFTLEAGESLLDALRREKYPFSAPCGGNGRCGKCRVRITSGSCEPTSEDRTIFTEKELSDGWRLACRLHPREPLTVIGEWLEKEASPVFKGNDGKREALPVFGEKGAKRVEPPVLGEKGVKREPLPAFKAGGQGEDRGYAAAIDIGTTTIGMQLLSKDRRQLLSSVSLLNSQRVYGADVISRIQAATDGKLRELRACIREDLQDGLVRLCENAGVRPEEIREAAISGNTTMVHLLMGYDCSTLGVFPFTPVNLDTIHIGGGRLLGKIFQNMTVTILPGISTYVGGDITAGLYACGFWQTDETALLVDLGTNGEMAVGNRARIWAASTAAGPAFEGGNISCGMGSVPGAIFSVRLADNLPTAPNTGLPRIKTIGGRLPLGLCGTGVIETAAELFQHHIIDENGSMKPEYFDAGFPIAAAPSGRPIAFTRRDVREIQLAKAAIRAGIETLLLESHITKEEISAVWLAGGFSQSLDVKKAVSIGLFPPEWESRIRPVGNTSLAGAAAFLQTDQAEETLKRLVSVSGEVVISGSAAFQDLYLKHLNFGA